MKTNDALITHARNFITDGGSPARKLAMNHGDIGVLRTLGLLRKEEWQALDTTLVGIARQRLVGVNDLRARGLSFNLGGLGVLLSQYEQLADMSSADTDFAAVTDGEEDSVTFTTVNVPVPIVHKSFRINARRLMASGTIGAPLDTTQVTVAGQKVAEGLEDLVFSGFTGGGIQTGNGDTTQNYIYGYTTEPNINTYGGSDWGTVTQPPTDVIAAIAAIEADNYFGPYTLYVATTQFGQLRAYNTDGSGDTAFKRVAGIPGIEDVRAADRMTAGTAVLVSMRSDVVDLAIGQDMTVVEWEEKGGLTLHFKVMAALAPRCKSDAAGGSGICYISGI